MYKFTQISIKKIDFLKKLKINLKRSLLISKDNLYKKYFLFKIKKSNIYKKYLRRFYIAKKQFKKIDKLQQSKLGSKFIYKKLFRNKSYKNIRSNLFEFKNNYHKYKIKTINIF